VVNTQPERRRHKRIGLEHLHVQAKTVFPAAGNLLDMGLNGACFSTSQWLPINNHYLIKFHLDGRLVSHTGTVRWVRLVGTKKGNHHDAIPLYLTGIEFTSVLTDNGKDILEVLNRFSGKRGQRLGGKRLRLTPPAKAVFPMLKECRIKQISSGGMLIETDLEFFQGESYYWAFNFPGNGHPVRCKGRIVSRVEFPGSRQYNYGVIFSDMRKEDRKNLARFILEAMFSGTKPSLPN